MFEDKFASYNMVEPPKVSDNFFKQPEPTTNSNFYNFLEEFKLEPSEVVEETPEQIEEEVTPVKKKVIKKTKTNSNLNFVKESFKNKNEFTLKMMQSYTQSLTEKGISSKYAKMLVAQDALESGWGTKLSGINNFGGIKGKGSVKTTKEEINGKMVSMKQGFRDFKTLKEYTDYKVDLLNNKRYHAFDGGDFFANIARGGYATSSTYLTNLRKVYNSV